MFALAQRFRRLSAATRAVLADPRRRGVPLVFCPPCYWIIDRLSADSVILDCGLGFDADFSQAMIKRYDLRSFGFDPTRRHQPALRKIAESSDGHFILSDVAIGGRSGNMQFFESQNNVSGSMMSGHGNVLADQVVKYDVPVVTIAEALRATSRPVADLVKLDIEGAEYDALKGASDETLLSARQWAIEFHHDTVKGVTVAMTREALRRFCRLDFRAYTRDYVNFLFYR